MSHAREELFKKKKTFFSPNFRTCSTYIVLLVHNLWKSALFGLIKAFQDYKNTEKLMKTEKKIFFDNFILPNPNICSSTLARETVLYTTDRSRNIYLIHPCTIFPDLMCQKTQFFELFLASLLPTTAPFVGQVPNLAEMLAARFLVGHIFSIVH